MDVEKKSLYFAFLAIGFWSTAATAFKIGLSHISATELLLIASITSLVIFSIAYFYRFNKIPNFRSIGTSAIFGLLNPFLYYFFLFNAYDRLPAQEALSLNYTWAIIVSLLSIIILKQPFRIVNMVAIALGFIGVVVIATNGRILSLKFDDAIGTGLALGSSVLWGFYWIMSIKDKRNLLEKMMLNFFWGSLFISLYFIVDGNRFSFDLVGLFSGIYIGIFEMGITFMLWFFAIKYSKNASRIANLVFLSPFMSIVLIALVLKEPIQLSGIIGLGLIIIGIAIQNYSKSRKQGILEN